MEIISNEEKALAELGDELSQKRVLCKKSINEVEDEIVKAEILYSNDFMKKKIKQQIEKRRKFLDRLKQYNKELENETN